MYESFYGFYEKPFSLLPDGNLVFPSQRHRRALTLLEYGVVSQAGFAVISGEVGAGKTTIIRRFLKSLGSNITVGLITNPSLSSGRLFDWIAAAFEIKKTGADDTTLYNAIVDFLVAQYGLGKRAILIVDEAQNLSTNMLEDLRMLSNINNERDLLLQIVLVGQPELLDTLKRPELRQFVQRIAIHCHLDPLTAAETAGYIRYRLKQSGGSTELFDDPACAAVYYFTGGVPRLINLLCDQSLVYGFSEEKKLITSELVAEVAVDRGRFGLSAFQNVPETLSPFDLIEKIRTPLGEIIASKDKETT